MRRIAIIPARGGSKRLPRKNIIDFMGKPIIAWTIQSAIKTNLFDDVIVSTEDKEISEIAASYGASIDMRDTQLATDSARVTDVCIDYLNKSQKSIDTLCCLYATAPLRNDEDIKNVVKLLESENCDSAIAVTNYDLPPHQALKWNGNNHASPKWPELVSKRADEIGSLVVDNGSTYAVKPEFLIREKSFYSENMAVHLMPRNRSQDIDEAEDLELALFYAQKGSK